MASHKGGRVGKPRILIAGAGIGGIVAALALRQRGFEVELYEQATDLREIGAGVQISPNGSRVLRALGLQSAMEAIASVPMAKDMRLFNTGQAWRVQDLGATAEQRFGSPYWLVHRGDFHQVLVQALTERAPGAVHVGARVTDFRQGADGVTLLLEGGQEQHGDVLIGADGVHSRVRQALFGAGRATFTGFMAWRGVVPMERLPSRLRQKYGNTWIGPHGHVVTYPLRRGELLNFVTAIERDDWLIESWSEAGTVEECRRDFAPWHEDVLTIIDAIDVPYKWAMLGREPLEHWSVERVTLLGDACHPTLPFLAQGANMAIEDGAILARCLDSYQIPEALRRYEVARLERTSRIVRGSLENVSRYHNPQLADPTIAQDFMAREFAPRAMGARYDWLYEYDALSVPI
jgi:2-polyprenyl-6-methoxyphenol hydroxylase-like FAD-dependent oxidoreductase